MTLYEIVMKLNGPIKPVGESHVDSDRLTNLNNLIFLVDSLLNDIRAVGVYSNRHEASMRQAGDKAQESLDAFRDYTG